MGGLCLLLDCQNLGSIESYYVIYTYGVEGFWQPLKKKIDAMHGFALK